MKALKLAEISFTKNNGLDCEIFYLISFCQMSLIVRNFVLTLIVLSKGQDQSEVSINNCRTYSSQVQY